MELMRGDKIGPGVKAIALLLILGGIAGIGASVWGEIQTLRRIGFHPGSFVAIFGVFILLFGWSVWTGFALWKGTPKAFTWAKIIFAAQILNFTVPGVSFDGFYTGLRVYLMFSQQPPNLLFGFDLESGIKFLISDEITNWLFGINFVAIAALVHLVRVTSRKNVRSGDKLGLI